MTQVMSKAKWLIPVIVIVAMLAAVGIVWGTSGGGSDDGLTGDFADLNPGYESVLTGPADASANPLAEVPVLYSITVDPASTVIAMGAADVCTVTVTNLVPQALANDLTGAVYGTPVTQNGDIMGNIVVYAYVQVPVTTVTNFFVSWTDTLAGPYAYSDATLKIIEEDNIIVHPGAAVTLTVPISPQAIATGTVTLYKAEFVGATLEFTPPLPGV